MLDHNRGVMRVSDIKQCHAPHFPTQTSTKQLCLVTHAVLRIQGRVLGAHCKTLISQLNSRGAVDVFLKMYWIYAY